MASVEPHSANLGDSTAFGHIGLFIRAWHISCRSASCSGASTDDDSIAMTATETISLSSEQPAPRELSDDSAAFQLASRLDPHYLFYCFICGQKEGIEKAGDTTTGGLPAQYSWTIWRPRRWPTLPLGLIGLRLRLRFLFRWSLHRMHLFAGPGSGVLLVYDRGRLAHSIPGRGKSAIHTRC